MVPAAGPLPDLDEGEIGLRPGEVHGHLAREDDAGDPRLRPEALERDVEMLGDDLLNRLDARLPRRLVLHEIPEDVAGHVGVDLLAGEARAREKLDQGAFELADVALDALGDELEDVVRDLHLLLLDLLAEDRDARLYVGRLDVRDEAPLEARHEALLERRESPSAAGRSSRRSACSRCGAR